MNFKDKIIGIWGFGVVGKSVLRYLLNNTSSSLYVIDQKELSSTDKQFCDNHHVRYTTQQRIEQFLQECDYIVPSPGIDLYPYCAYQHKWVSELDLFAKKWKAPLIAITGTLGKTSVTHLLSQALESNNIEIATGGNIGFGMLDLLEQEEAVSWAVLEVSSFQLEIAKQFTPDLAILTNIYRNHLDRHGSFQNYIKAKCNLFASQTSHHKALVPLSCYWEHLAYSINDQVTYSFFSTTPPTHNDKQLVERLYYLDWDGNIVKYSNQTEYILVPHDQIPTYSYQENWLIVASALDLLHLDPHYIATLKPQVEMPAHRIQKIATINGIDFYDDSKSTVPQATLAAVNKLAKKPIFLLLGGLSKGVDRAPLIQSLKNHVTQLFCFGAEAAQLQELARTMHIESTAHASLDDAFNAALKQAKQGDQILLSPAGSSFDLFADYKARGIYFQGLVKRLELQRD